MTGLFLTPRSIRLLINTSVHGVSHQPWGQWFLFLSTKQCFRYRVSDLFTRPALCSYYYTNPILKEKINHMTRSTLPCLICVGKMKCRPCTHAQEITVQVRKWENTQMPRRKLDLSILVLMYLWLLRLSDTLPHTPCFHSPNKVIMLPATKKKQALAVTLVHITNSWWCVLALGQDITEKPMSSELPNGVCSIVHVLNQIS